MPSSNIGSFENGLRMILRANPSSILDIGPGFGLWGFLSRMYLDMRRDSHWAGVTPTWSRRIDGVEAYGGYATAQTLQATYDNVYVATARDFIAQKYAIGFGTQRPLTSYDMVIVSHVLEHMPKNDGLMVLDWALEMSGHVLVGLPLDSETEDMDPLFPNPHERHASDWADMIPKLQQEAEISFIEEGTNVLALLRGRKYVDRTPAGWVDHWRKSEYL